MSALVLVLVLVLVSVKAITPAHPLMILMVLLGLRYGYIVRLDSHFGGLYPT
jgi:uncharacterized membrane protein YdjX (TVP38/TMEM64 family)